MFLKKKKKQEGENVRGQRGGRPLCVCAMPNQRDVCRYISDGSNEGSDSEELALGSAVLVVQRVDVGRS
jgi:hypothetical protein